MITYHDLVDYTKENHIRWDTDLFDVLRGFFNNSYNHAQPQKAPQAVFTPDLFTPIKEFVEPENGEYTAEDVLNLFST